MLELTVRLIASLAIVVGLLLLIAKVGGRRMRGRAGSLVQVVHRQPLSRTSSVSVVTVGTRVLVLGTTEHQVNVLTELDPDELASELVLVPGEDEEAGPTQLPVLLPAGSPARRAGAHRAATPARPAGPAQGPLAGSVLSVQTWRQALAAAVGKAS
jgi:flagellar protein FliO/FliZ